MIQPPLAAFLEEGLGIHVGTRNERLEPNGARALAVRVEEDGLHFLVYVPEIAAPRVLPDLERNGQIAVSLGRPTDDRACQVKGVFVGARPAGSNERQLVVRQWEGFRESLAHIGVPRATTEGWIIWPAVAFRVKATAIFEQTPGPQAGTAIA